MKFISTRRWCYQKSSKRTSFAGFDWYLLFIVIILLQVVVLPVQLSALLSSPAKEPLVVVYFVALAFPQTISLSSLQKNTIPSRSTTIICSLQLQQQQEDEKPQYDVDQYNYRDIFRQPQQPHQQSSSYTTNTSESKHITTTTKPITIVSKILHWIVPQLLLRILLPQQQQQQVMMMMMMNQSTTTTTDDVIVDSDFTSFKILRPGMILLPPQQEQQIEKGRQFEQQQQQQKGPPLPPQQQQQQQLVIPRQSDSTPPQQQQQQPQPPRQPIEGGNNRISISEEDKQKFVNAALQSYNVHIPSLIRRQIRTSSNENTILDRHRCRDTTINTGTAATTTTITQLPMRNLETSNDPLRRDGNSFVNKNSDIAVTTTGNGSSSRTRQPPILTTATTTTTRGGSSTEKEDTIISEMGKKDYERVHQQKEWVDRILNRNNKIMEQNNDPVRSFTIMTVPIPNSKKPYESQSSSSSSLDIYWNHRRAIDMIQQRLVNLTLSSNRNQESIAVEMNLYPTRTNDQSIRDDAVTATRTVAEQMSTATVEWTDTNLSQQQANNTPTSTTLTSTSSTSPPIIVGDDSIRSSSSSSSNTQQNIHNDKNNFDDELFQPPMSSRIEPIGNVQKPPRNPQHNKEESISVLPSKKTMIRMQVPIFTTTESDVQQQQQQQQQQRDTNDERTDMNNESRRIIQSTTTTTDDTDNNTTTRNERNDITSSTTSKLDRAKKWGIDLSKFS